MRVLAISLSLLFLTGCGKVHIMQIGPDTYQATGRKTTGFHTEASVEQKTFQAAQQFCEELSRVMRPVRWGPSTTMSYKLIFWALHPDDPRAKEPVAVESAGPSFNVHTYQH